MESVLQEIIDIKQKELEVRKKKLPLDEFIHSLEPSSKSFYDALAHPQTSFILECKKASPSKGIIREKFNLDEIIEAYASDAAAFSVLTDEKYFKGSFEYLKYIASKVAQPVLNKDFFIDPYQVYLARMNHADAILLMLSVLSDARYLELVKIAERYQLDILTEVSNEEEAERAIKLGAKIIGINNRNLRDLSTDLKTTEKLVPIFEKDKNPSRLIISESGLHTNQQVQTLAPLVDGFLVGSSLMAKKDIRLAVKQLIYGQLKICGITRLSDALLTKSLGATYIGLIFVPSSKRCVSQELAMEIVKNCPHNYVGVFADTPVSQVITMVSQLSLKAVQLHGHENQEYISSLRQQLPEDCEIWKAKGVSEALPSLNEQGVDYFLFDCKTGNQYGGTGKQFDWSLLKDIEHKDNLILAGGLNLTNLKKARDTGIPILDINSGIESAPGQKSLEKTQEAFKVLRNY
ncbi:MAG: bifunctional indole-3-glycerol-phosphate synthase TrpC/phosphoribosylanthranilate isomerase TrpF [Oligoflexales bacterium]|nr:bifunctional indole-3-glycerol-phosphate synthase TrpC/phosphoribosylanthranilate isomerase TrpF [Oligoflexales bacterium]